MHILVTCKNEEDPIKYVAVELPQHFSHYNSMVIVRDAQGQLTSQSLIGSSRNSKSVEMTWLSLLPASMKKIQSKIKALEWPQEFPHYIPMWATFCHGNQSSDPIWPKT